MNTKRLQGALIGCGYASGFQLEAWNRIPEVEIVAVASRNIDNAHARAQEFDITSTYSDYRQMLDSEELDFVDIATPPVVHLEMIKEAAKRNLHVLCQKPIAETLKDLRTMIDICEEAKVRFMVNENGRFQPWFRKMKSILDEGGIGRPFYCNFSHQYRMTLPEFNAGKQSDLFRKMPRLITLELGVHFLDTIRYLFGEPISLYSIMSKIGREIEGEDVSTLLLKFKKMQAAVEMSWASIPPRKYQKSASWGEYRIEGEKGTMLQETDGTLSLVTDDEIEKISFPEEGELLGYLGAQKHFSECLLTDSKFETSGTETLKTMELVFGAYKSVEENQVYFVGKDINKLE